MAKFQEWLEPEKLELLYGMARAGFTDKQIAKRIGISERTFYEWKHKYPQFSQALKRGKEVVDYEVEGKLLSLALGGVVKTTEEKILSDGTKVKITKEKYIPPNATACIFWLKNRMPDKWRDTPGKLERNLLDARIENLDAKTSMMRGDNIEIEDLSETDYEVWGSDYVLQTYGPDVLKQCEEKFGKSRGDILTESY